MEAAVHLERKWLKAREYNDECAVFQLACLHEDYLRIIFWLGILSSLEGKPYPHAP